MNPPRSGARFAWRQVRRVRVGSRNEPKLEAVREALRPYVAEPEVTGVEVESAVPEQPLGFDETLRGAGHRAAAALESGPCELAVGYEDGLVEIEGHWFNVGCAVVTDGLRRGLGLSSGFVYPESCTRQAVDERAPIGPVFDALWSELHPDDPEALPSGRTIGNVGRLTAGVVSRAEYARHAIVCALIRFHHEPLYAAPGAPP